MKVTLKEIAHLAGCSEATVSRALQNSPLISEKTRSAVFKAARQLNYQVGSPSIIGMIEPSITNPFYSEFIAAIEEYTFDAGYSMILGISKYDLNREKEQIDHLLRQGVQGIIMVPTDANASHIRALIADQTPSVFFGIGPVLGADYVAVDPAISAYIAARHLLERGHRHIGLINGPLQVSVCRARLEGYRKALDEFGLPFEEKLVVEEETSEAGGSRAITRLLPQVSNGMTGVFTVSDILALGVMRRLAEVGLRVPDDISLVSCDDIPVAAQLNPALTTVWLPKRELGLLAARFLLKQIEARRQSGESWRSHYPFQSATFQSHLIERESTRRIAS